MAQQTAVEFLLSELDIVKLIEREKLTMAAEVVRQAKQMEKEQLIAFHKWMLVNDTEQNAEKYFHYTDENMWHEFLNSK
jgi:hypothetical protein